MIKKLRQKFILISMISVILVLMILLGTINIINYNRLNNKADEVLELLITNKGSFPKPDKFKDNGFVGSHISPESPYETRFFWVEVSNSGSINSTDTVFIAAVSSEQAASYAMKAYNSGQESGFIGNYKFGYYEEDAIRKYIFLDCKRDLDTFRSFLTTSMSVSALGILMVFILVLILSKKVVKPIVKTYEKQKRFITDATHEIRTPITIIDANTEVLEMNIGNSEWTKSIKHQIRRLSSLIDSLAKLAKMEESQNVQEMSRFSLSEAVQQTADAFYALSVKSSKILKTDIESEIFFTGNEDAIKELLCILIDNAIKYSSENGMIRITLKKIKNRKEITVYNTVDEIQTGQHEIFFDRFYRQDSSRSSEKPGYGIGLSIAKSITDSHKGKIYAKSEDGKSILFTVLL